MSDTVGLLVLAMVSAVASVACAFHWRRCYRRGAIYYEWMTHERRRDSFNYWFAMTALAACGALFAGLSIYVVVAALETVLRSS